MLVHVPRVEPPFPLEPAFAPRTRAALAGAPVTAWAADLSISTCMALLAAVDECFLVGAPLYERPRLVEVNEAATVACARVLAACPGVSSRERPPADAGFSREFLQAWAGHQVHLYKHVKWAANLGADALDGLFAALAGCPPPTAGPVMYLWSPIARILANQQVVCDIVRGAAPTFEQYEQRLGEVRGRCHDVGRIVSNFLDLTRARLADAGEPEFTPGQLRTLLFEPVSEFHSLTYEALLTTLRERFARFAAMRPATLAATIQGSPYG